MSEEKQIIGRCDKCGMEYIWMRPDRAEMECPRYPNAKGKTMGPKCLGVIHRTAPNQHVPISPIGGVI